MISEIRGSPKEPVPGSGSTRIVAYSKHREDQERKQPDFQPRQIEDEPEVRKTYIYKADIEKIGATQGCPGCRALMTPGNKYRAKHTNECRQRVEEELNKTEEGKKIVERAS